MYMLFNYYYFQFLSYLLYIVILISFLIITIIALKEYLTPNFIIFIFIDLILYFKQLTI